jgi:hypothetical protein
MLLTEVVHKKPIVSEIIPDDGIWFQHESSDLFNVLKVISYDKLKNIRDDNYPIDSRKNTEDKYRKILNIKTNNMSFLYATPVKYNKFGSPKDYPGYTYYFKLSDKDMEHCVFDIIDSKKWMDPMKGKEGFNHAVKIWKDNINSFKQYKDKDIGIIYPRIEVIISKPVYPTYVYPQQEDRK